MKKSPWIVGLSPAAPPASFHLSSQPNHGDYAKIFKKCAAKLGRNEIIINKSFSYDKESQNNIMKHLNFFRPFTLLTNHCQYKHFTNLHLSGVEELKLVR